MTPCVVLWFQENVIISTSSATMNCQSTRLQASFSRAGSIFPLIYPKLHSIGQRSLHRKSHQVRALKLYYDQASIIAYIDVRIDSGHATANVPSLLNPCILPTCCHLCIYAKCKDVWYMLNIPDLFCRCSSPPPVYKPIQWRLWHVQPKIPQHQRCIFVLREPPKAGSGTKRQYLSSWSRWTG